MVKTESVSNIVDARVALVKDDHAVISQFVRSLFTLLYEVLDRNCSGLSF